MIYSRSAAYAIRALVHLSRIPEGSFIMARSIAEEEGIPGHFLAKILQRLARKGIVKSCKGPNGGFALPQPARQIRLVDVVEAVDGLDAYSACIYGYGECNDSVACAMHDGWSPLRSRIMEYLERNSIADLSKSLGRKRKELAGGARKPGRSDVGFKKGLVSI